MSWQAAQLVSKISAPERAVADAVCAAFGAAACAAEVGAALGEGAATAAIATKADAILTTRKIRETDKTNSVVKAYFRA